MGFEISGLDELQNILQELADKAKELEGGHEVSFDELFTEQFMSTHTNFSNFNELLDASPFEVNSNEDFEAIPDDEFDKYISQVTKFESWECMLEKASCEYAASQLGLTLD